LTFAFNNKGLLTLTVEADRLLILCRRCSDCWLQAVVATVNQIQRLAPSHC